MTPDEAVKALDAIAAGDPEASHGDADNILLETVPVEVADAYDRLVRRESGWWYA